MKDRHWKKEQQREMQLSKVVAANAPKSNEPPDRSKSGVRFITVHVGRERGRGGPTPPTGPAGATERDHVTSGSRGMVTDDDDDDLVVVSAASLVV